MKTWDDALQVRLALKKEVVRKLIREAIGCTRSLGNIASFKENFLISDEKIFRSLIMYGLIRMYTLLSIHIILKLQRKPIQIRNQTIFLLTPCRFTCFYCYLVKQSAAENHVAKILVNSTNSSVKTFELHNFLSVQGVH